MLRTRTKGDGLSPARRQRGSAPHSRRQRANARASGCLGARNAPMNSSARHSRQLCCNSSVAEWSRLLNVCVFCRSTAAGISKIAWPSSWTAVERISSGCPSSNVPLTLTKTVPGSSGSCSQIPSTGRSSQSCTACAQSQAMRRRVPLTERFAVRRVSDGTSRGRTTAPNKSVRRAAASAAMTDAEIRRGSPEGKQGY